jgi:signal transduction histidine kinase
VKAPRLSLLSRIWLSTSAAITLLFTGAAVLVERQSSEMVSYAVNEEVEASLETYKSVLSMRSEALKSVSAVISSLPHVRAAFGTGDRATIQDIAGELWTRLADDLKESAFFHVTDPNGATVAALDSGRAPDDTSWPVVARARARFPAQAAGFVEHNGRLLQLVLTPVYVDSGSGPALISVLVAGFEVNHLVAARLKRATGGSEFVFTTANQVRASTLNPRAAGELASKLSHSGRTPVSDGVSEYVPAAEPLVDLEGREIGRMGVYRSFDAARARLLTLRWNIVLMWIAALAAAVALSYWLVRRIVRPVRELDRAAAELARQNYAYRVPPSGDDELGRLAATFNEMCDSIESGRAELIRQERISTIGRLAGSIVHDLRNPLAAIYGGAEMMVDTDLPAPQMKRLAGNIYAASRRIQEMLQDLVNVSRGRARAPEDCSVRDILLAAMEAVRSQAAAQNVRFEIDAPADMDIPAERARMERVFVNLFDNALEVMPQGGEILVRVRERGGAAEIEVADTGPGFAAEVRGKLFQPFFSHGKKAGLGLGLALSRQTVLDHGGEMWAAEGDGQGARFNIRLPLAGTRGEITEQPKQHAAIPRR